MQLVFPQRRSVVLDSQLTRLIYRVDVFCRCIRTHAKRDIVGEIGQTSRLPTFFTRKFHEANFLQESPSGSQALGQTCVELRFSYLLASRKRESTRIHGRHPHSISFAACRRTAGANGGTPRVY